MLAAVDDRGTVGEGIGGEDGPRRVYPPAEVQGRLGLSASGLRRLAAIYERSVGPLPRDERGRVWPAEAIGVLEAARAAVRQQRAVSIEAALKGQDLDVPPKASPAPMGPRDAPQEAHTDPAAYRSRPGDAGAAILEELRALRGLVEEQNRRIGELEEAVRTGRELAAPKQDPPGPPTDAPGAATGGAKDPGGVRVPPGVTRPPAGRRGLPWWLRWLGR